MIWNPNDYTKKEARIIVLFNTIRENLQMLQQVGEGDGFKNQISEAGDELANILEVDSNFPLTLVVYPTSDSTVADEATKDSINAGQEHDMHNVSENSEDVNTTNDFGITKLAKASGEGDIALVKDLLSQGADPNLSEDMGEPPLLWAIRSNNDDIVKILLAAGADPNFKTFEGITPLMIAQENGANVILKYLEEYGAK